MLAYGQSYWESLARMPHEYGQICVGLDSGRLDAPFARSFTELVMSLGLGTALSFQEKQRTFLGRPLYSQQRGEDAPTITLAPTRSEIPLNERVLPSKTMVSFSLPGIRLDQQPVNAAGENGILSVCKSGYPKAEARATANPTVVVEPGIAESQYTDQTSGPSLFDRIEIPEAPETNVSSDGKTKCKCAQEARMRF
ncbi:hypothetical protein N7447_009588 [Penicillium robsamsonii]|uniref:uncharacterized protein n=1 Tax=Penicillium robsamsonii TaxID=1792511 RepID=UPI00254869B1|nr:uncharacterized protein N7447_009588 [Penicillium robsamsonii]KAJ5817355.1 hypothetical protein N7447_009588 [Penicillium robsamsonii]